MANYGLFIFYKGDAGYFGGGGSSGGVGKNEGKDLSSIIDAIEYFKKTSVTLTMPEATTIIDMFESSSAMVLLETESMIVFADSYEYRPRDKVTQKLTLQDYVDIFVKYAPSNINNDLIGHIVDSFSVGWSSKRYKVGDKSKITDKSWSPNIPFPQKEKLRLKDTYRTQDANVLASIIEELEFADTIFSSNSFLKAIGDEQKTLSDAWHVPIKFVPILEQKSVALLFNLFKGFTAPKQQMGVNLSDSAVGTIQYTDKTSALVYDIAADTYSLEILPSNPNYTPFLVNIYNKFSFLLTSIVSGEPIKTIELRDIAFDNSYEQYSLTPDSKIIEYEITPYSTKKVKIDMRILPTFIGHYNVAASIGITFICNKGIPNERAVQINGSWLMTSLSDTSTKNIPLADKETYFNSYFVILISNLVPIQTDTTYQDKTTPNLIYAGSYSLERPNFVRFIWDVTNNFRRDSTNYIQFSPKVGIDFEFITDNFTQQSGWEITTQTVNSQQDINGSTATLTQKTILSRNGDDYFSVTRGSLGNDLEPIFLIDEIVDAPDGDYYLMFYQYYPLTNNPKYHLNEIILRWTIDNSPPTQPTTESPEPDPPTAPTTESPEPEPTTEPPFNPTFSLVDIDVQNGMLSGTMSNAAGYPVFEFHAYDAAITFYIESYTYGQIDNDITLVDSNNFIHSWSILGTEVVNNKTCVKLKAILKNTGSPLGMAAIQIYQNQGTPGAQSFTIGLALYEVWQEPSPEPSDPDA
jgi:hypothetical protein